MKMNKNQKIIFFIFIPTVIALSIVLSLIFWVSGITNTIWIVAIIWGLAITAIDVVLYINTKLEKKAKSINIKTEKAKGSVANSKRKKQKDNGKANNLADLIEHNIPQIEATTITNDVESIEMETVSEDYIDLKLEKVKVKKTSSSKLKTIKSDAMNDAGNIETNSESK